MASSSGDIGIEYLTLRLLTLAYEKGVQIG